MIVDLNIRVLRNYIISIAFIISSIIFYFKGSFKTCIIIWFIVLIGYLINLILDDCVKMSNCTQRTLYVLEQIEKITEKDRPEDPKLWCENIIELYDRQLTERKTFKDEIGAIAGFIGTIIGSAVFVKFF